MIDVIVGKKRRETVNNMANISTVFGNLKDHLSAHIVGQENVIDQLLIALLAEGHALLEGVPGTAKTFLIKTMAGLIGTEFSRIQLTPDMLPSDIIGTSVYDLTTKTFKVKRGPLFTSLMLADEINRTPPKTQSALLEAMEERQVTIDGQTESLPSLFMVVSTQNPVEFEGTYPLPEAQLDRFMLKIVIGYPPQEAEKQMLKNWLNGLYSRESLTIKPVTTASEIIECREELKSVAVEESVLNYLLEIVQLSRSASDLLLGASPRAALNWLRAAKAHAALKGRNFVTPDNIKFVAEPILRHRLILKPESELDGATLNLVIENLLKQIPVPR